MAWELTFFGEPYWFSVLTVGLGELAVMVAAYIIFMALKRNKGFFKIIQANQNLEFRF